MDRPGSLSSRVEDFMKNNERLSETLFEEVQSILITPRQELGNLDAEIAELVGRINELKVKRDQIQKHIAQYDCLLSPIRRIPTDILHNIFYHCLPTQRDPLMSAAEAPLLLTRICRAWRQTAYASPRLWAQLYITFSDDDLILDPPISSDSKSQQISDILRLRCSVIEEWFSRSGACPLSISICYTSRVSVPQADLSPGNTDNTRTLFGVLTRFSSRWQRLELNMPFEVYEIFERMVPISQLPMLDSIRTSCYYQLNFVIGSNDGPVVSLLQAQNLRRLSLNSYPTTTATTIMTNPNLTKLTSLSLNCMIPLTEAISLLKYCRNLEYAMLTLMADSYQIPLTDPRTIENAISLPHLRALLIVDSINTDSAGMLYECLDAPRLEWVDYRKESRFVDLNERQSDRTTIAALLQRSENLKKLTIEGNTFTTAEMRRILRSAQSITHLVFGPEENKSFRTSPRYALPISIDTAWKFGDLFLEKGEEEGTGNSSSELALVPHMEVLEVSQGASAYITDQALLYVVLHRLALSSSGHAALLNKIAVVFSRSRQIDISKDLSTSSDNCRGIELELEYLDQNVLQSLQFPSISSRYGVDRHDRSWQYRDLEDEGSYSLTINDSDMITEVLEFAK